MLESEGTEKSYVPQVESEPPNVDNILFINNTGTDLAIVYGLTPGDIIKVYQDAISTTPLGTATVAAKTNPGVVITIKQLGESGGTVYLTRTATGKLESKRDLMQKAFPAE